MKMRIVEKRELKYNGTFEIEYVVEGFHPKWAGDKEDRWLPYMLSKGKLKTLEDAEKFVERIKFERDNSIDKVTNTVIKEIEI